MRDYATVENLGRAAVLSGVVTVMAVGRLTQGNLPLSAYVPLTFVAMLFVAGAVTSWGTKAGMPGIVTDRKTCAQGCGIALALAAISIAAHRLGAESVIRQLLDAPRHEAVLELAFPATFSGRVSLVLWSGGVQVLFLVAAPMAMFARLTGNRWIAAGLCLGLRAFVVYRQMADADIEQGIPVFMTGALLQTGAACFLFARYGLIPAMLFAAVSDLHVFLGR